MTAQEIFDKVWRHFVTEENPPSFDGAQCRYRGPDGTRCTVGIFIPDAEYRMEFDDNALGVRGLVRHFAPPSIVSLYEEHEELLCELQNAHDLSACQGQPIDTCLRHVADVRGLKVPE